MLAGCASTKVTEQTPLTAPEWNGIRDLNGDGILDLVNWNSTTNQWRVRFGTSTSAESKHLPVMSSERLVGIISAHDLEARNFSGRNSRLAKALETHPDRVRINSVMTTEVRTVTPSDNLAYAAELTRRERISALPVLERGRLAGIISRCDLRERLGDRRNNGGGHH
jgi:predicted transcriptional regulator